MPDLADDMQDLMDRLGPPQGLVAHVVQFVSAARGEGTSSVARAFADLAARSASRGVWLVELDLMSGAQHAAIAADPERYGAVGAPVRSSPDDSMFFAVTPRTRNVDGRPWLDARYLAAHPVGRRRFWVTRFRREALRAGQSVAILSAPAYWDALRAHADYVVIDAPAAERSPAALAVAPFADDTVLVVSGDGRAPQATAALRRSVDEAGGRCPGFVFNRARPEPPAFLRTLLP